MNTKRSISLATAALVLPAGSLFAQATGTAQPEPIAYTSATNSDVAAGTPATAVSCAAPAPALKPHPAEIPVVYGVYKPYVPAHKDAILSKVHQNGPSAIIDGDLNGGIAPDTSGNPGVELPNGTELKAFLQSPISTSNTAQGSHFTAVLTDDIVSNGVVLLPAGSLVKGRITHIKAGNHGIGPAAIHLQPDSISVLDGTGYTVKAEVTGLDHYNAAHVNSEGTIMANGSGKDTALAFGLTTGSAIVSGAVIGGGVGAAVGLGVGAGIATVWYFKHDHQQTLPAGTEIVFTLQDDLQLNPVSR
jgi:hypothetical protein